MGVNVVNQDSFTLGSGILYIDKELNGSFVNTGLLINDVTFTYTVELLKLEAGTPTVLVTQAKASEGASISFEVAEITALNIQTAMGVSDDYVETTAATPVNVTDEEISFSATDIVWETGHTDISAVSIYTTAGTSGTALTVNDDYVVDATNGTITAVIAGATEVDTTYYLNYTYTPAASKTIGFGGSEGGLPVLGIRFIHTRPSGKKITVTLHRASTSGVCTLTYSDASWQSINMTFDALASSDQPIGYQLGTIELEV